MKAEADVMTYATEQASSATRAEKDREEKARKNREENARKNSEVDEKNDDTAFAFLWGFLILLILGVAVIVAAVPELAG